MHLVEQLQVKKTEANNRLLSRKRKLSELFAATACSLEHSKTAANQQYFQQLQAFYDANDLQKGRFFDESTLPPRPQLVRKQRHVVTKPTLDDTLQPVKDVTRGISPLKIDLPIPSITQDSESRRSATATPTLTSQDGGRKRSATVLEHDESEVKLDTHVKPSNAKISSPLDRPSTHDLSTTQHVKVIRTDKDGGPAAKPSLNAIKVSDETEDPGASLNNLDRHSSPSSSNRLGSSTPVPTAGSPNTSTGEEDPPAISQSQPIEPKTNGSNKRPSPTSPGGHVVYPNHKMSVSSIDVDLMDVDPTTGFESPVKTTAPTEQIPKDISDRKPPIHIDTNNRQSPSRSQSIAGSNIVETPAPITGSETPRQQSFSTPISAVDSNKRATRISSGALLKKSVSEILGETPKPTSPHTESQSPSASKDAASSSLQGRQADRERKEKERTKLSTVVFAKPQRPADIELVEAVNQTDLEKVAPGDRDYLYTLFESKAYASKSGNLSHLIQHSHKTITTTDHLVDYEYLAQCRVLKRLYQLQSNDKWALRQRKRADEPARRTSHWDFLLDHAKWMRTDFREERKWKYAAARALAESCAEWVASSPEERVLLQVQVRAPHAQGRQKVEDPAMEDVTESSHPTPELLPSGEDESVSDDIADPRDISLSNAPAAIFSLSPGEFNFVADRTPAFDKLINELPLYEPAKIEPDLAKSNLAERLDARWRTDIVPVSRFANERLVVKEQKAPLKRSRYEYEIESSSPKNKPLPPREENVGLFMPENKHIRDRIHPGHSFRPPSEHPMPTQAFFETRSSSQWTPAEDDELRRLVKDYSYNWSLISSCLTSRSLYSSSPDRRTPWECFERWIGLEGMPADMAKTPYFRTYSGRIEAAGRHVQAQLEEAQRRANPPAPISARKRTTQPVRVDRKRASRHLAMLDAMRKLAKKRELHRQKQAHSADMAAMRKSNEINQPRLGSKTPAEWSALKHEREQKLAKQQELYRQQLFAHQRAAAAQQQNRGTGGPTNGVPNNMPQTASNARGPPNGISATGMPNNQLGVPNGVPRPHPGMMGVPNGMAVPNGMNVPKGVPGQMQTGIRGGMGSSPQQMRMLNEAQKMHHEQLMRQAQQNGAHSSPNTANATMVNGHGMNNPAFMAAMAAANGAPSPSGTSGNSGSPRGASMAQALSSGHVPVLTQIAASIKDKHPSMTDEEVQRLASQQLTSWQQQATAAAAGQPQRPRVNQAALNAAMGAANAAANAGMAAAAANGGYPQNMTNEQLQQYNHRLRLQQAQQHAARGIQGQLQPNMMGQMSNSPVLNMSRPVSQQNNQGMSRSATPREQSNGTASNGAAASNVNGNANSINGVSVQGQQGSPRVNQPQPMQT